jgi:hypothetical protein
MRRSHGTLTPAGVRAVACHAPQQTLPCKPFGRRVSVARLLDLLLLVAALPSSLAAVVRRFRFGFSHETTRQAVTANLPDRERLQRGVVDSLSLFGQRCWRKRRWDVAFDRHALGVPRWLRGLTVL